VERREGRVLAREGKLGRGSLRVLGRGKRLGVGQGKKRKGEGGVWAFGPKPEGRVLLFLFSVPLFLLKTKSISKHFQNQI